MRRNTLNLIVTTVAGVGLVALAGCSSGGDAKTLGPVPTTIVVETTTVPPTTPAPTTTTPPPTVVTSGTTSRGIWQLIAEPGGRRGVVCAVLRGPYDFGGGVCNEASEQDFNGDETLRYSVAGDGTFVIGVSRPNVSRVRMELRDRVVVERATVAASFTATARFVALPLPAGSVLRSLTAIDSNGTVLTRIVVNP